MWTINEKSNDFKQTQRRVQFESSFNRSRMNFECEAVYLQKKEIEITLKWLSLPKNELLLIMKKALQSQDTSNINCVISIINNNIFFDEKILNLTDLEQSSLIFDLVNLLNFPHLEPIDKIVTLLYLIVSSSQEVRTFYEYGIVKNLQKICQQTKNNVIIFHCIGTIANMAIDIPELRIDLLKNSFISNLFREKLKTIMSTSKIIKSVLFLISNVLIGLDQNKLETFSIEILFYIEFLEALLGKNSSLYETGFDEGLPSFIDICLILVNFEATARLLILNNGITFKLIQLLINKKVQLKACSILQELVRFNDSSQFALLFKEETINVYSYCLRESKINSEFLREVLFLLSNLVLKNEIAIMILKQEEMIAVLRMFLIDGNESLKRETIILAWNLLIAIDDKHIHLFFECELMQNLFQNGLLGYNQENQELVVKGLNIFLSKAEKELFHSFRFIREYIIEREIIDKLNYRYDCHSENMKEDIRSILYNKFEK